MGFNGELLLGMVRLVATNDGSIHFDRVVSSRLIPSHELGVWLLSVVDKLLAFLGLECDLSLIHI